MRPLVVGIVVVATERPPKVNVLNETSCGWTRGAALAVEARRRRRRYFIGSSD
jgi:hypothetical protein